MRDLVALSAAARNAGVELTTVIGATELAAVVPSARGGIASTSNRDGAARSNARAFAGTGFSGFLRRLFRTLSRRLHRPLPLRLRLGTRLLRRNSAAGFGGMSTALMRLQVGSIRGDRVGLPRSVPICVILSDRRQGSICFAAMTSVRVSLQVGLVALRRSVPLGAGPIPLVVLDLGNGGARIRNVATRRILFEIRFIRLDCLGCAGVIPGRIVFLGGERVLGG